MLMKAGSTKSLPGLIEDIIGNPVVGEPLANVLYDILFVDGSSPVSGVQATRELGQGWYVLDYTDTTGKDFVYVVWDGKASPTFKNFPGALVEIRTASEDEVYANVSAIKAKTDNLPTNPASEKIEGKLATVYNTSTNKLKINVWLEKDGAIITTPTSTDTKIYDHSGTFQFNLTSTTPDTQGIFTMEKSNPGFAVDKLFYAVIDIVYGAITYSTVKSFVTVNS